MAEGRDITAEVKRIIKEQLDVEEKDIKSEATFIEDLGADSLGLVELVLAFEEAFEIDIPDEDTEKIRTVQDAIDYIAAEGDYVMIHAGQRSYLLKDTIVSLQARLDPKRFLRIHRSTIVQAKSIRSLQRRSLRGVALILLDGTRLAVGPSFVNEMTEAVHARRWRASDADS